ncbi:hypothetical protein CLAVI_000791 [Candidatus Clavichlamydia salmonicola]|uniref:hypothetical protein n=1 Tax=Candidatus Clavichlamydia salmonicola TaxID=469812 RepID=UPI0018916F96|nr:hypothetical protein [Candidatus Clavichlamydia salmonicola]MBF5051155.1 hypothetical protein [Candidatus Clavichlamydia salmonicola]
MKLKHKIKLFLNGIVLKWQNKKEVRIKAISSNTDDDAVSFGLLRNLLDRFSEESLKFYKTAFLSLSGGLMLGNIDMGKKGIITGLLPPYNLTDAVNLAFLQSTLSNITPFSLGVLPLSGGTMQGSINMSQKGTITGLKNPLSASDAITLGFAQANYISILGSRVQGNLDMGGNKTITGLSDPVMPTDAVNLKTCNLLLQNFINSPKGFLSVNGGLMKGHIDMGNIGRIQGLVDPIIDTDAASLKTVKMMIAGVTITSLRGLSIKGGVLEGSLGMGGNILYDLADPVERRDAVNLQYFNKIISNISSQGLAALSLKGGKMAGPIDMNAERISGLREPAEECDAVNFMVLKKHIAMISADSVGAINCSGGSLQGNLDFNGKYTVTGICYPKNPLDSVNLAFIKEYFLPLSGGVMSGSLLFNGSTTIQGLANPIMPQDAVNLETLIKYIKDLNPLSLGVLSLSGGLLSGPLSMGHSQRIQDLADPQKDEDAVNLRSLRRLMDSITAQSIGALSSFGGVMSGSINMKNNYTVSGLKDPNTATDAVNLSYLNKIIAAVEARFLDRFSINEKIMTSPINMSGIYMITGLPDAIQPQDAVNLNTLNRKITEMITFSNDNLRLTGGIMEGSIDMGFSNTITGLIDPKNFSDAVNLRTLDARLAVITVQSLGALSITGGVMKGSIDMDGNGSITGLSQPVSLLDAVNLKTLNERLDAITPVSLGVLSLSGGTMSGDIDMGNYAKITGVANPSLENDVVNLQTLKRFLGIANHLDGGFLSLNGGIMKGSIDMEGKGIITGLQNPIHSSDAVNLSYMEAQSKIRFFLSRMQLVVAEKYNYPWSGKACSSWNPYPINAIFRSFIAPEVMKYQGADLYLIGNLGMDLHLILTGCTQFQIFGFVIPDMEGIKGSVSLNMIEEDQSYIVGASSFSNEGYFSFSSSCFSLQAPMFNLCNDAALIHNFRLARLQWSLSIF